MKLICLARYDLVSGKEINLQKSEPDYTENQENIILKEGRSEEKPSSSSFYFFQNSPLALLKEKLVRLEKIDDSKPLERFNEYICSLDKLDMVNPVELFSVDNCNYYYSIFNNQLYLAVTNGNPKLQNLFVLSWFYHMHKGATDWSEMIKNPLGFVMASVDKIVKIKEELHLVEEQMHINIESILERGERLENLVERTEELATVSLDFRRRAEEMDTGCCDAPRKTVNRVWR